MEGAHHGQQPDRHGGLKPVADASQSRCACCLLFCSRSECPHSMKIAVRFGWKDLTSGAEADFPRTIPKDFMSQDGAAKHAMRSTV